MVAVYLFQERAKLQELVTRHEQFPGTSFSERTLAAYASTVREREVLVECTLNCDIKWRLHHAGKLNPNRQDINRSISEEISTSLPIKFLARPGILLGARSGCAFVLFALTAQETGTHHFIEQPAHVRICPSNVDHLNPLTKGWWEWSSYVEPVLTTRSDFSATVRDSATAKLIHLEGGEVVHSCPIFVSPNEAHPTVTLMVAGFMVPRGLMLGGVDVYTLDLGALPVLAEELLLAERDALTPLLYPVGCPPGIIGFFVTDRGINPSNKPGGVIREGIGYPGGSYTIFSPYRGASNQPIAHSLVVQFEHARALYIPSWEVWRRLQFGPLPFSASQMIELKPVPQTFENDRTRNRHYPIPSHPTEPPRPGQSERAQRFATFVKRTPKH